MATTSTKKKVAKKKAAPSRQSQLSAGRYSVRARQPSRGRAGETFTDQPRTLELTTAQVKAIEADPLLEIKPA